ncbi:nicotinamide mononucleotide transporter [Novosphingobium sp. PhB57]|jgi:nicotinamide mononucleotide transporter|uniref:nicotinamide riboside transporter PnuC n=1 Tax=unclassified Novosphingobium TaxID=2644732 RepID=UPI0010490918|nr:MULTISPECIES: nicotinamide riboside transporter PnuC [unclassified Novosphingobium]TCU59773.1 nicotinamide mononucleotide transporter [Novosphingobium sp. PhB57]TDW63555.1 nicotinamide mononucleotide transporter [Novosphingobium sp. PhB55]
MDPIEWAAAALGLANIALLVQRSVWNYPFGMAMVMLYFVVFWDAKLYGEAGLQLFFFAAQIWGWVLWVRAGGGESRVPVRRLGNFARLLWLMGTAALALNLGWVMHKFTDASLPYADSAIAGASIAAQILLGFRRIENWVLWIMIDVASIGVYIYKGLWPTTALYVVLLAMSVLGLREWIAAEKAEAA